MEPSPYVNALDLGDPHRDGEDALVPVEGGRDKKHPTVFGLPMSPIDPKHL